MSDAATERRKKDRKARRLSVQGDVLKVEDAIGSKFFDQNADDSADKAQPTLPYKSMAMRSQAGYNPWNPNKVNQDRVVVNPGALGDQTVVMGCFDGHGQHGEYVSQFLINNLAKVVAAHPGFATDPMAHYPTVMETLEQKLESSTDDPEYLAFSGSTGVSCFIKGNEIWTANVGDSRAVMGRPGAVDGTFDATPLSIDHKPDDVEERERIESMGGRVKALSPDPLADPDDDFEEPCRVWLANENIPGLAMSRSFGDTIVKPVGVVCEPTVLKHEISPEDKVIILGSDGIWDFIPNEEAVKVAMAHYGDPEKACQKIVEMATKRWEKFEEVVDDISTVVVFL